MKELFGEDLGKKLSYYKTESGIKKKEESYKPGPASFLYKKLEWQENLSMDINGWVILETYRDCILRVRANNWHRLPMSAEIFSLMIKINENNPSNHIDVKADSFYVNENLGQVVNREGNNLYIFEKVSEAQLKDGKYEVEYSDVKKFSFNEFETGEFTLQEMNRRNPDLVEYLYSRRYKDLPDFIKNHISPVKIIIPDDFNSAQIIRGCKTEYDLSFLKMKAACRGVREK